MTRIKATIYYKVKPTHPDYSCIPDYTEGKELSYSDTYSFNDTYNAENKESMEEYIRRDMKLVAGGGYNADHIYDVRFVFGRGI